MKKVYILRGLPSSGKTTKSRLIKYDARDKGFTTSSVSADYYFECQCCGHYRFIPSELGQAHQSCQKEFIENLELKIDVVVVDNTNTTIKECKFYVENALKYGYEVEFVEPATPWAFDVEELAFRSLETHKVPKEAIQKMLNRWVPDMSVEKCLAATPSFYTKVSTGRDEGSTCEWPNELDILVKTGICTTETMKLFKRLEQEDEKGVPGGCGSNTLIPKGEAHEI